MPAVHRTLQADDALPREYQTLADRLSQVGIQTTGFCNNPLVGVIQNGFKRGFDKFYNYCGVVPSTPQKQIQDIWQPFRKLWSKYIQILQRLSYPIQNAFASPNEFFMGALRPFFVPMWTRAGNFKGMTERSIKDTAAFVSNIEGQKLGGHFVFLNLMETHLPYSPPDEFVRKFVPYFHETPDAQQFMRNFNKKAMQWLIPLVEPLSEVESATLSDMYDAEVAYQDHLLGELLESLDTKYHRDNSMVVFLADHGEMLGEHGYMGHGFGLHEELIRVPMFMRIPEMGKGISVDKRVSITQLFYTLLDYFGFESLTMPYVEDMDIRCRSLLRMSSQNYCGPKHVISEAYGPENAIKILEDHFPELINQYHADKTYRAVYDGNEKMIDVEGISQALYDLSGDPNEMYPYQDQTRIEKLAKLLDAYLETCETHQVDVKQQKISLQDDVVQQRLRDLGYIE
jgi:uncharacterized sulfatase